MTKGGYAGNDTWKHMSLSDQEIYFYQIVSLAHRNVYFSFTMLTVRAWLSVLSVQIIFNRYITYPSLVDCILCFDF